MFLLKRFIELPYSGPNAMTEMCGSYGCTAGPEQERVLLWELLLRNCTEGEWEEGEGELEGH